MKKKLLTVLIALSALLLSACGQSATVPTQDTTAPAATAAPTTASETTSANVDKNKTYEYEVREIWVENQGEKIYGEAYIPKTDGKSPLILTSHGMGSNHVSGASYAKKYAPRGFAVYTWDFRGGSNKNNENRSDGSNLEMSVMTEVSDVEVILEAAKKWDFVDTDRIFLQGGSQGGLVSAISGVRHEEEIAGLILLYPAYGMAALGDSYSDDMPEEIEIGSMTVGKPFFRDMIGYDVRDEIPDFDKPVLILQGSEDNIVLPSVTRAAADLYPDAEYHIIEGAGHGFSGEHHDEATQYALDFLFRHI
ncbi:MAG: alpha/beta hydrolase [Ruminococcus sp.]|nr:alpha/beta hydrolase [Ruminococcus sp.]